MNRRQAIKWSLAAPLAVGLGLTARRGIAAEATWLGKEVTDAFLDDYFKKIKNFNQPHPSDVFLPEQQRILLKNVVVRLQRLERAIGHANFHLLSFDEALNFAEKSVTVGNFSKDEVDFLENIFFAAAKEYGFLGEKPITRLTDEVPKHKVVKVPATGNFLFKGPAEEVYHRVKTAVGADLQLTSGIRGIVKQYSLFLTKVQDCDGNLSMASRSLAPPGYSFHGIGDFDVGQIGLGALNFTAQFAETRVFSRLKELGYLKLRYTQDNTYGVRFEPWHIQVIG
ncbi:MAG: D-alanyl-D-alanine carboxypeptidase family protein [Magnetococcales bacterium]|nr:D-alanyl-D-alanine carboxypeptidase family protein [Magnetococcales bacterium]MBF0149665.1 D-alanyl-D-alanine carboxypeptidase family protein [Magnetococcales bacterium]MBF0172511.1 D-alanyl-D-alanine carboxypeptidase family protein [Magnetococcales bacterium]MBF0348852.1 D-alanyl-D-alanine carboxypeptidase family protein [Magnetococcales bacterium]MBF0631808.1 D-alanyl-D-alanine carboxypeptidase family protein [Magnetococcales bacterium]